MDPVISIERPVLLGVKIRRIVEILPLPLSHFDDSSETVLYIITDHSVVSDLTSLTSDVSVRDIVELARCRAVFGPRILITKTLLTAEVT